MQAEHQVFPCLACGGTEFETLLDPEQVEEERAWLRSFHAKRIHGGEASLKDKAEFTQAESVFILRCNACRTLLRNPQPTPDSLQRLYRFDEYGERTLQELLDSEREFFRAKAALLDLPSGARVLEIGSFVGAFLLAAREKGWQASGVDIGKETCAFTQGLGLEVREGDVLELDIKGPVDAICVWNTFDQINRPGPLLDRCHELLKAGGQLVIRVPNGAFESACLDLAKRDLQSVRTAQAYNNFLTFPYLCGYTPGSITALLARHGFNVTSLHGDVIVPLAGSDTKPCAIEEEVRYKRLVHRLCTRWLTRTGEFLYPWMDVVATAAS